MIKIAQRLLELAEEAQELAKQLDEAGGAINLGDRDKLIARAGAFIDAAGIVIDHRED